MGNREGQGRVTDTSHMPGNIAGYVGTCPRQGWVKPDAWLDQALGETLARLDMGLTSCATSNNRDEKRRNHEETKVIIFEVF